MTDFGYVALNIALVLSAYSSFLFFAFGKNPQSKFIASANRAVWAGFTLITFSSIALLYALYTRNFQVEYVAHYSNRSLSWFYTGASFWAGQAGSMLLWAWLLSLFSVIVISQNKSKNPELLPYTMAVMSVTTFFFLYLLTFKTNPFAKTPFIPADGTGLNPLLQNPEMIFHPPSLYVGFVAFTVPFAFAFSALLSKKLDEQWIKSIRRWTLFAWLFLTIGNILGMQWAYVELGWGGYWAWDPVENSSLLPWLTGTAFLHSVIVQERKGMLKIWNISLIAITFALTIFGTFVTRSGLISSMHAFGVSQLGPLFLGFLALILISSAWLLYKRAPLLRNQKRMGSWSSKESSFMLNNVLFIAITLGVFLGTIMPTISEALYNNKMTVGTEFFNRMATPIGIAIFMLLGVCSLLAWGKTDPKKLLRHLAIPGAITFVFFVIFLFSGIRTFTPLLALAVSVFAITTTVIEYFRGVLVKRRTDNMSVFSAILKVMLRHKRRYGGYIVHLGVLLLFLGITGSSAFRVETTKTIRKGDTIRAGKYQLVYQGISTTNKGKLQIDAANFRILNSGKPVGTIKSEKHYHPNFQPATEVGIRSTLKEDLYVILANYDRASQMATISVLINPLVIWMWIGGIVMVLGTLLAMTPNWKKAGKHQ